MTSATTSASRLNRSTRHPKPKFTPQFHRPLLQVPDKGHYRKRFGDPTRYRSDFRQALHQIGIVRGEVVQNDMDLAASRLRADDLLQQRDELLAGVADGGLADDFSGLRIQRCIERECSVAVVLEAVLLGPAWRVANGGLNRSRA